MKKAIRSKLFRLIYSKQADIGVFVLVFISVLLFALDSVQIIPPKLKTSADALEHLITLFFVLEYGLKLLMSPSKIRFVRSNIIELLAIFPLLRVFRVFRIFRMLRDLGFDQLANTLKKKLQFLTSGLSERTHEFGMVSLFLTATVLFGTLGILHFEKGNNQQFQTFSDGVWWTIVTLTTVGYGDKFPLTMGGKCIAVVLMIFGLSFFALITSFISSFIIDKYRREEHRGMDLLGLKKHTIVCGWNNNSSTILKELSSLFEQEDRGVVVIAEEIPDYSFEKSVKFLKGDFTQMETLLKAQISEASSVIIVSDQVSGRSSQDTDARTILAALSVYRHNPKAYVCVELNYTENIDHAHNANVDEVIVASDYTGNLLAHAVKNHGITNVFSELLTSSDGSQFYRTRCPKEFHNKSFDEALTGIRQSSRCILLGVFRNGQYLINPSFEHLMASDELVYVGHRELNI